jgi:hypothetical protein
MLANVVPLGLLSAAIAVALWAWHEIRDLAIGWQEVHVHRRGRDLPGPGRPDALLFFSGRAGYKERTREANETSPENPHLGKDRRADVGDGR